MTKTKTRTSGLTAALAGLVVAAGLAQAQPLMRIQGSGVASGSLVIPDGPFTFEYILDTSFPETPGNGFDPSQPQDFRLYLRGALPAGEFAAGDTLNQSSASRTVEIIRNPGNGELRLRIGQVTGAETAFGSSISIPFTPGSFGVLSHLPAVATLTTDDIIGLTRIVFNGIFIDGNPRMRPF
ncbi:MAG: hypothetical protein AAGI17_07395 [Planctomycetota bacterium]